MTVDFGVFGLNFSLQNPIQDPLLCSNKKYSKCMFPTDDSSVILRVFFFNAISEHLCKFFVNELCFFVNIYIAIVFFQLKAISGSSHQTRNCGSLCGAAQVQTDSDSHRAAASRPA